jgi:hypothetical protein
VAGAAAGAAAFLVAARILRIEELRTLANLLPGRRRDASDLL